MFDSQSTIASLDLTGAKLLIVDDEDANLKLMRTILESQGYRNIASISDSRTVSDYVGGNPVDLILLDLNMPYLNGFEVMSRLYDEIAEAVPPILVITAQASSDFKKKAFDAGARDYLIKPFAISEVLARVRNLLQAKLLHDHLCNQNEILEKKVQERTQEIYSTRLEIVRRLGRAAEYRDNETGLHIVRMSKISELLGLACGMEGFEADLLLNASPMHDIGKIGIPDSILLKPGKLDSHEWEIMKTHTTIGANILSGDDSDILMMAREIAISHHEKWDGSGYPGRLEAEAIPLVGRIVAVADVFDALTSERPYKNAWSVEDAVAFINDQKGQHFDPQIVKYFNEILPDIVLVKEKYAEPESSV